MKSITKLHDESPVPWKNWFLSNHDSTTSSLLFLSTLIRKQLPHFRSLTTIFCRQWYAHFLLAWSLADARHDGDNFPRFVLPQRSSRHLGSASSSVTRPLPTLLRPRPFGNKSSDVLRGARSNDMCAASQLGSHVSERSPSVVLQRRLIPLPLSHAVHKECHVAVLPCANCPDRPAKYPFPHL
jgi:hypothetical protein